MRARDSSSISAMAGGAGFRATARKPLPPFRGPLPRSFSTASSFPRSMTAIAAWTARSRMRCRSKPPPPHRRRGASRLCWPIWRPACAIPGPKSSGTGCSGASASCGSARPRRFCSNWRIKSAWPKRATAWSGRWRAARAATRPMCCAPLPPRRSVPLIRDLASFALISPLMGERRLAPQQERPLPESIVHAVSGGDFERDAAPSWDLALPEPLRDRAALAAQRRVDALHGALADFARREPVRAGGVMIELYRLAQADPALHELLVALVGRLPVRPPYVPGFRRLFKYAEMIDDAAMFGQAARRFEAAKPMYGRVYPQGRNKPAFAHVPEAQQTGDHWLPLTHLTAAPDARTALSHNTVVYLKRRIWRALRKRGETGQGSFVPLAAALFAGVHRGRSLTAARADLLSLGKPHAHRPSSFSRTAGGCVERGTASLPQCAGGAPPAWHPQPLPDRETRSEAARRGVPRALGRCAGRGAAAGGGKPLRADRAIRGAPPAGQAVFHARPAVRHAGNAAGLAHCARRAVRARSGAHPGWRMARSTMG